MLLLNSKRLKALKKENDELKTFVREMGDKQKTITSLDELIKKIRAELSDLHKQQLSYTDSIEKLKESERNALFEVEKLNQELNCLRELKAEEQNSVLILSGQINELKGKNTKGNGNLHENIYPSDFTEQDIEIRNTERKKNELHRETIELESKLKDLYGRIIDLTDQEKALLNSIDKKSKQLDAIESFRLIDAQAELDDINNKINNIKRIEKKSVEEFQDRIKTLSLQEKELQNKVALQIRELEEAEEKLKEKTSQIQKDSEEKTLELIVQEQNLIDSIELKKNKVQELSTEITSLEDKINKKVKLTEIKIQSEEISLTNNTQAIIRGLQDEAAKLKDDINQLKMTEELKRELIAKLKDDLSAKEIEFAALENDFNVKSNQLKELSIKNQELAEEIEYKNNTLSKIDASMIDKKDQFDRFEKITSELQERIEQLNNEITTREILKTETENKISSGKAVLSKLRENQETLKKNILALEAKQKEIQGSNKLFENRFVKLFEKYRKDVNELNTKRNVLEQMLNKKVKDIEEKDNTLLEKTTLLDETEKVLLLRQKEIDSFEDLLKIINDQKEFLKGDLQDLDSKAAEKKLENQELKVESDILRSKISEFEKNLHDLLNNTDERLQKSREKREKLDGEIREYEIRLKDLNNDIKDSMNELVDLQSAVGKIKVEHEEHRLEINKLASLRNKLFDEINKSRVILDKYKKIRERIRGEQESIIKRKEEKLTKELKPKFTTPSNANTDLPDLTKIFKL
jgi:chromosome segregation ATPase